MFGKFIASLLLALLSGTPITAAMPTASLAHPAALNAGTGTHLSYNWSGYTAQTGTFTGVGATWNVPNASTMFQNQSSADATWIGVGGVGANNLIQAGTQTLFNANGQATYQAWYETLPNASQPVPLTIAPGNSMSVSVVEQTQNAWTISFANNTTGQTYQLTIPYASSRASAEWIEEMPTVNNQFATLDAFGTVSFTNAWTIQNNVRVTPAQAGAQALTMVNGSQQVIAQPSALDAQGASFSVTRIIPQSQPVPTETPAPYPYTFRAYKTQPNMHAILRSRGRFSLERFMPQWLRAFGMTHGNDKDD